MNHELFQFPFFGHEVIVTGWKLMGSIGSLVFAGRWIVQFFYARRAGRPVTPLIFWIMSLFGSVLQLVYFIFSPKQDMVGIMANFLPSFVAAYNFFLELAHRDRERLASRRTKQERLELLRIQEKALLKEKHELEEEIRRESSGAALLPDDKLFAAAVTAVPETAAGE